MMLCNVFHNRELPKEKTRSKRWFDNMEAMVMKKPALIVYTSGTTGPPKVNIIFIFIHILVTCYYNFCMICVQKRFLPTRRTEANDSSGVRKFWPHEGIEDSEC